MLEDIHHRIGFGGILPSKVRTPKQRSQASYFSGIILPFIGN
jgi:hypothetical protein